MVWVVVLMVVMAVMVVVICTILLQNVDEQTGGNENKGVAVRLRKI